MTMATNLTPAYQCGYCLAYFRNMKDPRELPCQHPFCIVCMQNDLRFPDGVKCLVCKEVHRPISIVDLPKATLDSDTGHSKEATTPSTTLTCEGHNCQGQMAVTHCVECEENLCAAHHETHQTHFGDKHQVVPISVYEQSPESFKKSICEEHQECLVRVCKKCDKLICNDCDIYEKSCTGQTQHNFVAIKTLSKEVDGHLEELLKVTEEKIKKVVDLDKDMWYNMDEEADKCDDEIEKIKKARDEQIKAIQEHSAMLIDKVHDHQREIIHRAERSTTQLSVKLEQLEEKKAEILCLMSESHISEKVRRRQQMTEEVHKMVDEEVEICSLPCAPVLVSNSLVTKQNMDVVTLPSSVTLISSVDIKSSCYSACHREDGSILIGTDDGIKLLSKGDMELTDFGSYHKNVCDVKEYKGSIYIVHRKNNKWMVDKCWSGDITQRYQLLKFDDTEIDDAGIAVSEKYIAAIIQSSKLILIYNFLTKQIKVTQPSSTVQGVSFLPDGCLLAIYETQLVKYSIDDGELTQVWRCEGLEGSTEVVAHPSGYIHVYTTSYFGLHKDYIVSPEGVKLKELPSEKPYPYVGAISMKDDVLAVPGFDDNKLHLLKVNR